MNICLDMQRYVPCFCLKENLDHSVSYKARTSNVSSFTIPRTSFILLRRRLTKINWQSSLFKGHNLVLTTYQAGALACFSFGWCRISNFKLDLAQKVRRKTATFQIFVFTYLTLLVTLQLLFWTKIPETKREEFGSPSKYDFQKRQRMRRQCDASHGFCATQFRLAIYQYQSWDSSRIPSIPLQN